MSATFTVADLFAGAGGTSTGLVRACRGRKIDLVAINHWDIAVETHSRNHPWARHLCTEIDAVDPKKVIQGGRLNLLVASPECIHFSTARGGRPMCDQSRASAWLILRWLSDLYVDNVLIENVREFESWGPLGHDGRPLKSRKGQTFVAFIDAVRSLGYSVEWRVLNAADYGAATTRERLFIIARRGNRKITWPAPTHAPHGRTETLFGSLKPWRPAREIIDWSIKGESIFQRKRPLAKATLERIYAGMRKFRWPEPFFVILRRHMNAQSIDGPLPTLTASGNHVGLVEPVVLGQQSGSVARPVGSPLPTIATDGAIGLVEPFVFSMEHGGFVMPGNHGARDRRTHSLDRPMPTITTADAWAVVEPFLVAAGGPEGKGRQPHSVNEPMGTVLTETHDALVQPFITAFRGSHAGRNDGEARNHSIEEPLKTLDTANRYGLVEPFLVQYNGTADWQPVNEPLHTVTAKDRYGIVTPDGYAIDVLFRMLQPHELAAAMSFPPDYEFAGNREQKVRQIGNAVDVRQAEALIRELAA